MFCASIDGKLSHFLIKGLLDLCSCMLCACCIHSADLALFAAVAACLEDAGPLGQLSSSQTAALRHGNRQYKPGISKVFQTGIILYFFFPLFSATPL